MCVDSYAIDNITIKYKYPIPRLKDMRDEFYGDEVFSLINLRSGYYQIRIRNGNEWKMTVKRRSYKWLVILFRLSNYPSTC